MIVKMIVKCSHCKKMLPIKEFDTHKCKLPIMGIKTIPVVYFIDTSCNGNKLINGWGTDGILYTFEVVPRKPIPIAIPIADEKKHPFKTDEDVPVPKIAKFIY